MLQIFLTLYSWLLLVILNSNSFTILSTYIFLVIFYFIKIYEKFYKFFITLVIWLYGISYLPDIKLEKTKKNFVFNFWINLILIYLLFNQVFILKSWFFSLVCLLCNKVYIFFSILEIFLIWNYKFLKFFDKLISFFKLKVRISIFFIKNNYMISAVKLKKYIIYKSIFCMIINKFCYK